MFSSRMRGASNMASRFARSASTMSFASMSASRPATASSASFGAFSANYAQAFNAGASTFSSTSSPFTSTFANASPSSATFSHSASSIATSTSAAGVPAALAKASVVNGLSRHCVSPVWTIAMVRKLNKIPLDTRQPQSYFYILIHSVFFNPSFLIFSELIFTLHLSHPREKHNEDGKRFAIGFCWVGVGFS
ncbi:hypothetical protein BC829DRAFT_99395 [Chytridium lagenaria]|nr:hypothetical protein BC829DRAFT_99395 [Chytridium lagenaria]